MLSLKQQIWNLLSLFLYERESQRQSYDDSYASSKATDFSKWEENVSQEAVCSYSGKVQVWLDTVCEKHLHLCNVGVLGLLFRLTSAVNVTNFLAWWAFLKCWPVELTANWWKLGNSLWMNCIFLQSYSKIKMSFIEILWRRGVNLWVTTETTLPTFMLYKVGTGPLLKIIICFLYEFYSV